MYGRRYGIEETRVCVETNGSLYRSLLTHSIVLFVCVGELRLLYMDVDPSPLPGRSRSISLNSGLQHGSTVENVLQLFERVVAKTERRIEAESRRKLVLREAKRKRRQELDAIERRRIEAFEANDLASFRVDDDGKPLEATAAGDSGAADKAADPSKAKSKPEEKKESKAKKSKAKVSALTDLRPQSSSRPRTTPCCTITVRFSPRCCFTSLLAWPTLSYSSLIGSCCSTATSFCR